MRQSEGRLLFVPVSGPEGTGEYYRCLAIARAIQRRRPNLEIHFLLNRAAVVERDRSFSYHLLDRTPSLDRLRVSRVIERLWPDLTVFDCTGRKHHFHEVRAAGGQVVWISDRPHKRRRAFNPRLSHLIDLHLIAVPGQPAPALGLIEKCLMRLFGPKRVAFVSGVAPEPLEVDVDLPQGLPDAYAAFVTGGGGYEYRGRPVPELFVDAARRFREETGLPVVAVMGPQYRGGINSDGGVQIIESLPTEQLGALLHGARIGVLGAGFMLTSQALAARLPLVLAAVGGRDQPQRVRRYQAMGLALSAELDPDALCEQAARLVSDPDLAKRLVDNAQKAGMRNDVVYCAERLLQLLDERS